eukprot:m.18474 g.18474  ORF g.18474 m.18474 type:complete len:450 (-) comp3676_c0_seq1:43-1392(-)
MASLLQALVLAALVAACGAAVTTPQVRTLSGDLVLAVPEGRRVLIQQGDAEEPLDLTSLLETISAQAAATLQSACACADDKAAAALESAKSYADELLGDAKQYADEQVAAVDLASILTQAKSYTDDTVAAVDLGSVLTQAKQYTDVTVAAVDLDSVLNAAKTYTNEAVASLDLSEAVLNAQNYTDVAVNATREYALGLVKAPRTLSFPDGTVQHSAALTLLAPNIIHNGFMNQVSGTVPTGYSAYIYSNVASTMTLTAMHPFTMCFEGIYANEAPSNAASTCEQAGASNPYWFARYWKGPRVARGGLTDGWGTHGGGNILRIHGTRKSDSEFPTVQFPKQALIVTDEVLVRCWIKIVKGSGVRFGTDYGTDTTVSKAEADAAPDGWYFLNRRIRTSHITNADYVHALHLMPWGPDNRVGDYEVYIALPYMANVDHGDSPNWMPSVDDVV